MSQVSAHSMAHTVSARSGRATVGAVMCNFRQSNAEATAVLRETAMCFSETSGSPVPGWAELFGIEQRRGQGSLATLIFPAEDNFVHHFAYDGRERMAWRALGKESVVCVVLPSTSWFSPVLDCKLAKWAGDGEMLDEVISVQLTATKLARGRYEIKDKYERVSGVADAPSKGVALLAVLLCALEGGCAGRKKVSDLEWEGGRHDDGFISVF